MTYNNWRIKVDKYCLEAMGKTLHEAVELVFIEYYLKGLAPEDFMKRFRDEVKLEKTTQEVSNG